MDLSVVIINYKSREPLIACLDALLADVRGSGFAVDVLVIDNASGDGSIEMLAERYPSIRRIANPENVGYARAVNQGIRETAGPYLLVLNPDCEAHPGALRVMRDYLDAHPGTAMVGPRMLNTDGTLEFSARAFPTPWTFLFNRYSLLTRLFPGNPWSRRYLLSDWDHSTPRDIGWLSGACMLVRRAAIEKVGGMDETFFMFNEDVDWCRRMQLGGWANTYVPAAAFTHHIGASKGKVAPKVIWSRHLGMIHYLHKHHPTHFAFEALAAVIIMSRAMVMLAGNALKNR
jgi:GT2 family glycosyltransferase